MEQKELYKKVDEKVGNYLLRMQNEDPFLYHNMENVYATIENAQIPNSKDFVQGALPYVPIVSSLSAAADFLGECCPEYKEVLWKKYRDSELIITYGRDNKIFYNYKLNRSKIFIQPEETLCDAMNIIHEVFHETNNSRLFFRQVFTETVSIASELLFLEKLEDSGYSKVNTNLLAQTRGIDYIKGLRHLKWMLALFINKKRNVKIDENIYDKLHNLSQMSSEKIERNLNVFLMTDITELERYKYVIGYVLAKSFVSQNHSLEELAELSNTLKEGNIGKFYDMTFGIYNNPVTIASVVTKDEFSYRPVQFVKKPKHK